MFTTIERTDPSPKKSSETSFAFLDRSARPEIAKVRDFVSECLSTYPANERGELESRIASGDDVQFDSATFELLVYGFLSRIGFDLEPHPLLNNGSAARPDFLVRAPDGEEFYLEAVLASEDSGGNESAEKRKGLALDTLAATPHENFLVTLVDEGDPTTQPSGKRLSMAALSWLNNLDPELVAAQIHQGEEPPTLEWNHEGWRLKLNAFPLKPEKRGKSKRLVGGWVGPVGWIDSAGPIRDAVRHKGNKYGDLGKPLVVAVNFSSFTLDRIDEVQALYGQEQFIFDSSRPDSEPVFTRARNGAWMGKGGPQGRRCSAMWSFNNLTPYTVAVRRHTVYLNPWAHFKGPKSFLKLPHATSDDKGRITWREGIGLRETFGLPDGWPE